MRTLALLLVFVCISTCLPARADDLHIFRRHYLESFTDCTTSRVQIVGNQAQIWLSCPHAPTLRRNPAGVSAPRNRVQWDWYVTIGISARMGEGCSLRSYFQGAFGFSTTELECRS